MALPFTNAQQDSFFDNGPQMSLPGVVRARLAAEGLATVEDFEDFKQDQLERAFKNMRTSIPGVPAVRAADGSELTAAVPAILPFIITRTLEGCKPQQI